MKTKYARVPVCNDGSRGGAVASPPAVVRWSANSAAAVGRFVSLQIAGQVVQAAASKTIWLLDMFIMQQQIAGLASFLWILYMQGSCARP